MSLLIVGEFVAEFEIGKRICFLQISKNKNQTFKWVPFFETKSCSHEIHDKLHFHGRETPRVSKDSQGTVDGSEIPFPTTVWMYKNPVNNGMN